MALERTAGPSVIALSRQNLPVLPPEIVFQGGNVYRGAYILREGGSSRLDVLLLATGSEVHVALEARGLLEAEGISTRVVSCLGLERFREQPEEYRSAVLPPHVRVRVSAEAGATLGWDRYVGDSGAAVGIDRFGASAPGARVFRELGITAEAVAERAKAAIAAV